MKAIQPLASFFFPASLPEKQKIVLSSLLPFLPVSIYTDEKTYLMVTSNGSNMKSCECSIANLLNVSSTMQQGRYKFCIVLKDRQWHLCFGKNLIMFRACIRHCSFWPIYIQKTDISKVNSWTLSAKGIHTTVWCAALLVSLLRLEQLSQDPNPGTNIDLLNFPTWKLSWSC